RQYLIFNLLASGKVAWDQGDFPTAAQRWETLLSLPGLDPEIDKVVRPLAEEARKQGGGKPAAAIPPPQRSAERPREEPRRASATTVEGTVNGGGTAGPGGAVITLRRTDGTMPKPQPAKKIVLQQGKAFVPRVL